MTAVPFLVRRLLVAPLVLLVEAALVVASPVLALIGIILSPLAAGSRFVRVVAITIDYCVRHLACTAACGALWVASGFGRRMDSPRMRARTTPSCAGSWRGSIAR